MSIHRPIGNSFTCSSCQVHIGPSVSVSPCFISVSVSHVVTLLHCHGAMSPQTNMAPVTVGKTSPALLLSNCDKIR